MKGIVDEFIKEAGISAVTWEDFQAIRGEEEQIAVERNLPDFRYTTERELLGKVPKSSD